ncbi:YegS/Rv2252/BmrU family lipid kinase [Vallitalea pronyensis]|uniref:YegS/Rv2252/BmrU family lipid kinase n=1 Tax=Vallitalea pronyensis TaxID=1348613 RepID=A0A8J8SIS9_9FIRM|nr:YegS/Rv2252/BmrU family lipid kinase [Vallitalea pronyensis]QUI24764.1 YegS/Rv2252/BmrU family lipid kinase [Vallitalea pronyensis]
MRYVQLIYNPMSGNRDFPTYLDLFISIFQDAGYETKIHRSRSKEDVEAYITRNNLMDCQAIIVAGGDGSVNQVVNCMMKQRIYLPLGVIPAGTANDFASHIKMPLRYGECFEVMAKMHTRRVDVGQVNDKYFINVCCGGLFANISQNMDIEFKNTLGKLGYYIKGVQQLPRFRKIRYQIESTHQLLDDYFFLFLVLNGNSAGGFNKLGLDAQIDDGKMDFVGIKACSLNEMAVLFGKILIGDHLHDRNVVYFQDDQIAIKCVEGIERFHELDIDGEKGPNYPLNIRVRKQALEVICPPNTELSI